jgi:branched-chain amino acid transport system permease protein
MARTGSRARHQAENIMAGLSLDLIGLQLFTGVALGAVYVLLAIGLSLIFGMLTVVNFAHGAFYMLGAYVGLWMLMHGANFWLCLVGVPLAIGAVGLAVERVLIRPLYGRGIDYPLLLTFGLSYIMVELVRIAFGNTGYPVDTPEALQGAVDIGVGYFPLYRLFVIGVTAVILAGLWVFLEKTSYGLIIRAGARDPQIVRILGVDVSKVWLVVFGLGTAIAGVAGLLAAPLQGVIPEMGGPILAEAFVVTVVGGMGSLMGAVLAGLLVGVVVSLTSLFAPEMAKVSIFLLMAVVLLVRPQGFFGRAGLMS